MAYIYDLTDTWNAGGTTFNAIKMNVTDSASAAGSKLVTLQTNGTEHFSVTKAGVGYFSGNVGIGTSSPTEKLTVAGPETGNLADFSNGVNANFLIKSTTQLLTAGPSVFSSLAFQTNSVERMRIDASGNVGIGTTTPTTILQGSYSSSCNGLAIAGAIPTLALYDSSGTTGTGYLAQLDTTTALYNKESGPLTFGTSNLERMRIDGSGNVGIGTTSPLSAFTVNGAISASAGNTVRFYNSGNTNWSEIVNPGGGQMALRSGAGEAMRIDGSSNVGIGTSSPNRKLSIQTTGGDPTNGLSIQYNGDEVASFTSNASSGEIRIGGTGVGTFYTTFYTNNTERMRIDSSGNVGIGTSSPGYTTSGRTTVYLNGTSSSLVGLGVGGTEAGYIGAFSSTAVEIAAAGASRSLVLTTNGAERARIDSSGNLLVGATSTTLNGSGAYISNIGQGAFSTGSGGVFINFINNANTAIGSITNSGNTATAYNTSSDYRLKDIDGPITNSGAYIDALKPVQGSWKADGSRFIGLLAHEVQEVSETPIATGEKDGEEIQAMDYSAPEIIANLIAEIQSLRARVAQLEGN